MIIEYRIIIFFASNPEIRLTREDLARKFEVTPKAISAAMRKLQEIDLINGHYVPGRGHLYEFFAGPALIEELGG